MFVITVYLASIHSWTGDGFVPTNEPKTPDDMTMLSYGAGKSIFYFWFAVHVVKKFILLAVCVFFSGFQLQK
jgi:hypothetical protein